MNDEKTENLTAEAGDQSTQTLDPLAKLEEISKKLELLQKLNEKLEEEYVQCQSNLQGLQTKYAKLATDYAGLQTDYQGALARHSKAVGEASKFAASDFAMIILSAMDMIEVSIDLAKPIPDISHGLKLVLEKMRNNIQMKGVEKIQCEIGSMPDPTLHCIVKQEVNPDYPVGSIISILQDGYSIHERLLRPASVVVAQEVEVSI